MPLVLTVNETTESGHRYADRPGQLYEFPSIYESLVREGERFLHYRGRRRAGGGRQPQVYLGQGIVGKTAPSVENPDRLACQLIGYRAFTRPVPFRDSTGAYLEPGGVRRGYFQRGVRTIRNQDFDAIVELGSA